jgi:hypothetical protein
MCPFCPYVGSVLAREFWTVSSGLSNLTGSGLRRSKPTGRLLGQWSRPLLEVSAASGSGLLRSVKSAGDAQLGADASAAALADRASLDNPWRPAQVQIPASVTVPALSAYPRMDP